MNKSIKISTYVLIVIFFLPNVILSKEKDNHKKTRKALKTNEIVKVI